MKCTHRVSNIALGAVLLHFTACFTTAHALVHEVTVRRQDYTQWGLPEGAVARLGKGTLSREEHSITYSPDGHILAVATSIGVWLYDARTCEEIALLTGHSGIVRSVAFSPDGKTLASAGARDDNTVKLWSVETGAKIATLKGHSGVVYSVAFSPDGKTLASGSREVTIWSVLDRIEVATLKGHRGIVLSVAFSPDGKTLASGSTDKTVKLWSVEKRT